MDTQKIDKAYAQANAELAQKEAQASVEAAKRAAQFEAEANKEAAAEQAQDAKAKLAEEKNKVADALKGVTKKALDYGAEAAEFIAEKSRKASSKL